MSSSGANHIGISDRSIENWAVERRRAVDGGTSRTVHTLPDARDQR